MNNSDYHVSKKKKKNVLVKKKVQGKFIINAVIKSMKVETKQLVRVEWMFKDALKLVCFVLKTSIAKIGQKLHTSEKETIIS